MVEIENKIRIAIQNSHFGSGKLLTALYQEMLVHGISSEDLDREISDIYRGKVNEV